MSWKLVSSFGVGHLNVDHLNVEFFVISKTHLGAKHFKDAKTVQRNTRPKKA